MQSYSTLIIMLLLSISVLGQVDTFNQVYQNKNYITYPLTGYTRFHGLVATDTAYYVIGNGLDSAQNWFTGGVWMKLDTNGLVQQQQLFGYDTAQLTFTYNAFLQDSEGNLLFGGSENNSEVWSGIIYKLSQSGDTIWIKNYAPPDTLMTMEPLQIARSQDKGYYMLYRIIDFNSNKVQGITLKVDSLGQVEWSRIYIPPGFSRHVENSIFESNNKLILVGFKANGLPQTDWDYKMQTYIHQLDTAQNITQSYTTNINRYIGLWDGIQTQDGGIVFCGGEGTQVPDASGVYPDIKYRAYIAKVDSNFQLVWEHTLGHYGSDLFDVDELPDGSIIAVGDASRYFPDEQVANADSFHVTGWMIKFSPTGDSLWQRKIIKYTNETLGLFHAFKDIEVLSDGRLLVAGYIEDFASSSPRRGNYGWLVRTDSLGCIVPGCHLLSNTQNISILFDNAVTVYPNPASDRVNFRLDQGLNEKAVIRVYSGLGQLVGQTALPLSQTQVEMNVSNWHRGVYFYGIYVEGQLVKQGQVLIEN